MDDLNIYTAYFKNQSKTKEIYQIITSIQIVSLTF